MAHGTKPAVAQPVDTTWPPAEFRRDDDDRFDEEDELDEQDWILLGLERQILTDGCIRVAH